MILSLEKKTNKLSAALLNNNKAETYECWLNLCNNPECICGIITLELIPIQNEDSPGKTEGFSFDIDIYKKALEDDSAKINVEQIFKLMSPHTEVRTI